MKKFVLVILCFGIVSCSKPKAEAPPESDTSKGPITVEMKSAAQKHVGLVVSAASLKQLTEYLQVTGTVQPIDSRLSPVRALARGRVIEVLARVGDRVTAGQILARFDNIEAGELFSQQDSARAELEKLKLQAAAQAKQVERNRRLVEIGAAAQKDYELAEAEQQGLGQSIRGQESVIDGIGARLRRFGVEAGNGRSPVLTTIRAPFGGVVTKAQIAAGEVVDTDRDLFTVADLSRVWVQAEVYEKDLGRIRMGQTAFVTVDTYPDERFTGTVSYVSDILDPQTRTARVRCEVANPQVRLKLDMFASVQVPTTFSREAFAVPVSALQQVEEKDVLFIQTAPTKFEPRPVQIGKTISGLLEIISGLTAGEQVVTEGAFHLKSILVGKELGEE
jgi:cobalt-zinc-cadmium efflux system membrane fusion protein